jgi:archaellum component FlaC
MMEHVRQEFGPICSKVDELASEIPKLYGLHEEYKQVCWKVSNIEAEIPELRDLNDQVLSVVDELASQMPRVDELSQDISEKYGQVSARVDEFASKLPRMDDLEEGYGQVRTRVDQLASEISKISSSGFEREDVIEQAIEQVRQARLPVIGEAKLPGIDDLRESFEQVRARVDRFALECGQVRARTEELACKLPAIDDLRESFEPVRTRIDNISSEMTELSSLRFEREEVIEQAMEHVRQDESIRRAVNIYEEYRQDRLRIDELALAIPELHNLQASLQDLCEIYAKEREERLDMEVVVARAAEQVRQEEGRRVVVDMHEEYERACLAVKKLSSMEQEPSVETACTAQQMSRLVDLHGFVTATASNVEQLRQQYDRHMLDSIARSRKSDSRLQQLEMVTRVLRQDMVTRDIPDRSDTLSLVADKSWESSVLPSLELGILARHAGDENFCDVFEEGEIGILARSAGDVSDHMSSAGEDSVEELVV